MLKFEKAAKKAINLSLNASVLAAARDMGLNISQTWEKWNEDNQDAIAAYNARVARHGIWGAQYRTFGKSLGDGREES